MEGLLTQARQLREDLAAGGASFADRVRDAQFQQRTVGFTSQGQSAAQINESASTSAREALRTGGSDSDIFARLQSLELERTTRLRTLELQTTLAEQQVGGAFSRMSSEVQQQIVQAAKDFGRIPAGIIAGIAKGESSGNLNVGLSKSLGEDGRPSSAFGLGQITRGTAEEAIRRGYLPQGYDRTDTTTMAQGIAGVLSMKLDQNGGDLTRALMAYRGSRDPAVNRSYAAEVMRNAGQFGDASATGLVRDQDAAEQALKRANDNVRILTESYGRNGAQLEAQTRATDQYNSLIARGVSAADAASIAFGGLAEKLVSVERAGRLVQALRDDDFARDQLGRDRYDQQAYATARARFGDTSSTESQAFIERARETAYLTDARSTLTDAMTGFTSDLRRGASAADAITNALGRVTDKLISSALDSLVSGLFKGATGSGNGMLSGLLGGSGASNDNIANFFSSGFSFNPIPGFASGGLFGGVGGPQEDMNLARVSRGEYIINAAAVQHYGPSFFDGLNTRSVRSFAGGGPIGGYTMPRTAMQGTTGNADASFNLIDQRPSGSPDIEPVARRRSDGGLDVIIRGVESQLGKRAYSGQGPFRGVAAGAGSRIG